jgi:hypothetical protein
MQRRPVYPLPFNKSPKLTRCIQFTIPDDDEWENLAYSALYDNLAMWLCWERDSGKNATKIAYLWRQALKTWQHCDGTRIIQEDDFDMGCLCEQLRFHNGKLQALCCGTWQDVDGQPDNGTAAGSTNQPSPAGSLAPGACYTGTVTVDAVSGFKIPVPLSGDMTIQLTNMKGMWSGDLALTSPWHCPNGNVNVLGQCALPGFVAPSDSFIPTSAFMCVILVLVTSGVESYIDVSDGAIHTIPTLGASEAYLAPNHNDASNNRGNITVDINVCKPAPTPPAETWCYTMDFTSSDYGWTVISPSTCTQQNGQGFVSGDDNDGTGLAWFRRVWVKNSFTASDITSIEVVADYEFGETVSGATLAWRVRTFLSGTPSTLESLDFDHKPPNGTVNKTYTVGASIDGIEVYIAVDDDTSPSGFTGEAKLKRVVIQGNGTNPFGDSNC